MAHYRIVDVRIWSDEKFRALSHDGKLVFLYCLTHPNLTALGVMRANIPGLAIDLGFEAKAFRKAFGEALVKGLLEFDERSGIVWFPRFIRYNPPQSPNVIRSWVKPFDLIPEGETKILIYQNLKTFTEGLSEGFRKAFDEAFEKLRLIRIRNQEQDIKSSEPSAVAASARARGAKSGKARSAKSAKAKIRKSIRLAELLAIADPLTAEFHDVIAEAAPRADAGTVWRSFLEWIQAEKIDPIFDVCALLRKFASGERFSEAQWERRKAAENAAPVAPAIAALAATKRVG